MKLDPHRLEVLHAVVERGSMSAAALELRFSPAAVSQHIAVLERQAGTPLLVRHARGVRPTPAGELLAGYAREQVTRLRDAERELERLVRGSAGAVRLGIFASAAVGLLPQALTAFAATHPGVDVEVDECDVDVSADRLRAGSLDVAVVFDDPGLDVSGLELTGLADDPVDVVLPATHRHADSDRVELGWMRDEHWVLASGAACADLVRRACLEHAGFEPQIAMTTDDHAAAFRLAAAGMGVAAVPRLMGLRSGDGAVVRALDPAPSRTLQLATRPGNRTSPAVAGLLDALRRSG